MDVSALTLSELTMVQHQLDLELRSLVDCVNQLHNIFSKMVDCVRLIKETLEPRQGGEDIFAFFSSRKSYINLYLARIGTVLVPITSSLFCDGELPSHMPCLVDIGAGFLIEMVIP